MPRQRRDPNFIEIWQTKTNGFQKGYPLIRPPTGNQSIFPTAGHATFSISDNSQRQCSKWANPMPDRKENRQQLPGGSRHPFWCWSSQSMGNRHISRHSWYWYSAADKSLINQHHLSGKRPAVRYWRLFSSDNICRRLSARYHGWMDIVPKWGPCISERIEFCFASNNYAQFKPPTINYVPQWRFVHHWNIFHLLEQWTMNSPTI